MKKTGIVWMVMGLVGMSQASVIYSNNFSGTEFAAAGIPVGVYNLAQNSSSGVLEATTTHNQAGFRVDLTSLNLSTLTAIKVSADIKIPSNVGTIFLGFGNESNDWNMNAAGDGMMSFPAVNRKISVSGGVGSANNQAFQSASNVYPTNSTFKAEFTYYTNNTVDVVVNGINLYTGPVTSSVGNNLDYVYLNLYSQNTEAAGGATFDNLVIESIPEPTTLGLFAISGVSVIALRRMTR